MTKLLLQALAPARGLLPDAHDDIARVVLRPVGADEEASPTILVQLEVRPVRRV